LNRGISTPLQFLNFNQGECERCENKIEGKIKMGEQLEKCLCIHAEARAVLQNSRGCQDSTLYVTEETVSNVLTYFISWNRKGCLFGMTRTEKGICIVK
jgi:hypothetical protein